MWFEDHGMDFRYAEALGKFGRDPSGPWGIHDCWLSIAMPS
jgi:hypothetical protein